MNSNDELLDEKQMRFMKKHWRMTIVFAAVFAVAVTVAVLVFLWFIENAQTTALLPSTLGEFTVGYLITFILHVIFWELLLVGSWVLVIVVVIYLKWYNKLPEEERLGGPKRGSREEGDAIGFLIGVFWLIIIWTSDRWDLAFNAWTLTDWVISWLTAVGWVFVVFGIPIGIYFIYWIMTEREKET
ncbi:MAG: hypothetical protein ACFFBL_07735 [Promethearchaeota archaeon]